MCSVVHDGSYAFVSVVAARADSAFIVRVVPRPFVAASALGYCPSCRPSCRAFASLGAPGEDALERTRRRFSFSEKYQIVPRVGAFDDTTTLAVIRHSDEPNVARSTAHGIGFFVTLADVDVGEELTMHHGRDANVEIEPTGGCGAHYEWTIKGCDPPWVRAGAGARARGGIDYSKWDDICSSSESD